MTDMSRNGTHRRLSGTLGTAAALALTLAGAVGSTLFASRAAHAAPPVPLPPGSANGVPSSATPATAIPTGPLRLTFAGVALPVPSPSALPYRDPDDGILCIAPSMLAPMGVTYVIDAGNGKATFSAPDGASSVTVPVRTPPPTINGGAGVFVAAMDVIEGLGGKCEWFAATNTLEARAVLTSVEMLGGQVRIKATFPVTPVLTDSKGGRQIVIDVHGAEIGKIPHTLDLQSPLVSAARAGQFQDDVARVVLEMKQPYSFSVLGGKPGMQMILNPTARPDKPEVLVASSASPVRSLTTGRHARSGKAVMPTPVSIVSGVTFRKISDDQAQFLISANRAPSIRAALSKGRLTLDLLNTTLASKVDALSGFEHPFLKAVRLVANGTSAAQLVLDLTRAVVYTIRPSDKGPVELDLSLPRGASGKLSGKTIVIDAGHGGHDPGASGVNGTVEKNVNLAIATQLASALRDAGANVILTRSTDYFIPVDDRPLIANRANADFFVSIHADSSDHNHSVTGSTVYYHYNQPSCRTLAQCIADRMAVVGDIRSRGIGSDGIRFPGIGYGVLRGSQMAAVLVECGYMSNSGDVQKMNLPATQKKVALAVVAGLRDYIEGNPNADTRDINPQPDGDTKAALPAAGNDVPVDPDTPLPTSAPPTAADDVPASAGGDSASAN